MSARPWLLLTESAKQSLDAGVLDRFGHRAGSLHFPARAIVWNGAAAMSRRRGHRALLVCRTDRTGRRAPAASSSTSAAARAERASAGSPRTMADARAP